MRFTHDNVELPDKVLAALDEDRLAIFVGAGASARAYPNQRKGTFYPTFRELVMELAERTRRELTREQESLLRQGRADLILGQWSREDRSIDLHRLHKEAAAILSHNVGEQRIELHRALISLFRSGATPRIVTTNFDDLLVRAEDRIGKTEVWRVYEPPGLPPAQRFSGICHLHGRASSPEEMVLTDRDIGRAYMDEGWALRFAHTLFREFHVLFVGYSLEDPPLRYLSLALEGEKPLDHWALLAEPRHPQQREETEQDWLRRGVRPIWYPAPKKDHRALTRTVRAWAEDQSRTFIDKRDTALSWAASDPRPLADCDRDRMRRFLSDPDVARDVFAQSLHQDWFEFVAEWGLADGLLRRDRILTHGERNLSQWLARQLIGNPNRWMARLAAYRPTVHPEFLGDFFWIADREGLGSMDVDLLKRLLEFLSPLFHRANSGIYTVSIDGVMRFLLGEGCTAEAAWLTSQMVRPMSHFRPVHAYDPWAKWSSGSGASEDASVMVDVGLDDQSADYSVREVFTKILIPAVATCGEAVLDMLLSKFREIRDVSGRVYGVNRWSNMGRAAIEPNEQDEHRHSAENLVIDLLRDTWEALLVADPSRAARMLDRFELDDDPLIERLVLHALRKLVDGGHAI